MTLPAAGRAVVTWEGPAQPIMLTLHGPDGEVALPLFPKRALTLAQELLRCGNHQGYHLHGACFEMAGGGCSTISGISKQFDGHTGESLKSRGIERKRSSGVFLADKLKLDQRTIF